MSFITSDSFIAMVKVSLKEKITIDDFSASGGDRLDLDFKATKRYNVHITLTEIAAKDRPELAPDGQIGIWITMVDTKTGVTTNTMMYTPLPNTSIMQVHAADLIAHSVYFAIGTTRNKVYTSTKAY